MSELRASQAERYRRERKNLTNANTESESLGNEDGTELETGKGMVYGNEPGKGNGKVQIKLEGEVKEQRNGTTMVHKS